MEPLADQRLSHLLEDAVHDGAIGAVLHSLWLTCERAGKREDLVLAIGDLGFEPDADLAPPLLGPPRQGGHLPFFPATEEKGG